MTTKIETTEQIFSYGIGLQMGDQLSGDEFSDIEVDALVEGIKTAIAKGEHAVSRDQLAAAFGEMQQRIEAKQAEQHAGKIEEGAAFLAENAAKDGVITLDSGLQYEIITEGTGEKPTAESTVRTHYHGTLTNGTVFDSSYDRGQPAEFPVGGVIAGWTEALQLMPVGSKWKLTIPANLAYGERGAGGAIGPHETLQFDIELLDIV